MIKQFSNKIDEQLKEGLDSKGITKIVGICVDVLVLFSWYLKEQGIQSLRAYFGPIIYTANVRNNIEVIRNSELLT